MRTLNNYLFDTNALYRNLHLLDEYSEVGTIFIPHAVLEELDKHKSEDNERAFQARRAVRHIKAIEKNKAVVKFDLYEGLEGSNDNKIIDSAIANNCTLVTGDYLVQLKAKARGVQVIEADNQEEDIKYTGVKELFLSNSIEHQELLLETQEARGYNLHNLLPNQYLLIHEEGRKKAVGRYRWTGSELVDLQFPNSNGKYGIKSKNDYQAFALDLLMNTNIPIKIVAGTYGSGKTYLTIRSALYLLKNTPEYSKIMVVRNPIGAGQEVGFLPGSKEEKIGDFFKPIEQNLDGGEFELQAMIQQGQLECEIPFYMKGQTLLNTFVMVDEAEDLNIKTLKLIGTRLADKSCIVFSGDYKQAEGKFVYDNGLLQLIEKKKGNPLVGIVVMPEDVRSQASKVFADL